MTCASEHLQGVILVHAALYMYSSAGFEFGPHLLAPLPPPTYPEPGPQHAWEGAPGLRQPALAHQTEATAASVNKHQQRHSKHQTVR